LLFIYIFNTVVTTMCAAMKLFVVCLVAMLAITAVYAFPAVNSYQYSCCRDL